MMKRPATHFADRIWEKTLNAIDAYLYERGKGMRWASSVKRYGEDAAREYGDRFLVELIQNAYDANPRGSTGGKVAVTLNLGEGEHGVLYVANTGRAFTDDNFNAITDIAQSDKPPGEGIGNKGVGFKSVLQVSERPEVYSACPDSSEDSTYDGYCFRFPTPSDIAKLVKEQDLDDVLHDVPPHALPIPIDRQPDRVVEFRRAGFCTVIRLPLHSARAAQRAEAEIHHLATITTPLLLFLDRIALLQLLIEGQDGATLLDDQLRRHSTPISSADTDDGLLIAEVDLGKQGTFVVASRPISGAALNAAIVASAPEIDERWASWKQDATVSVAAQLDHTDSAWRFYTFLPMDDSPVPFAAHANAPFFAKLDRNSVRFAVPFNNFLLDEIAALCADAALWIRDNAPTYAPLCLDLICWNNEHLPRLLATFEDRGIRLEAAELVPIVSRDNKPTFGAIGAARRWGPFNSPLTTVTAHRLCADTDVAIVDPRLGDRAYNFSGLRTYMSGGFDDGSPTDDELATWLERIAKKLRRANPQPPAQQWMDFYDDIATVFADRHTSALQGRRLIIDNNNRLQRCGTTDDASTARTVFFSPVRDRTEGEEDVDSTLDVKLPRELSKVIAFTREDLDWYVKDGKQHTARKCRHFMEREGLVRRYRTQDVLDAVGRFVTNLPEGADNEAKLEAALHFVYKLRDRATDAALEAVGLHVPTKSGWHPAREASFSEKWPNTQGHSLAKLIQLTASTSPALAEVGQRLLQAPHQWLPDEAPLPEWTHFLRRLGVRDGLHPTLLTRRRFRAQGSLFTAAAWARHTNLSEEFARTWKAHVEHPNGFTHHPMTLYTSMTQLWGLPGQFEFEEFSPDAQERYAALLVANLDAWPPDRLKVGIRRANHPQDAEIQWPTPLQVFLCNASWVPVRNAHGLNRCTSADAWFFDDDQQESPSSFAPLMTWSLRRATRGKPVVRQRLRSWCGIRCWNDPHDAADLVRTLFTMLDEGRIGFPDMASFGREYERAVHRSITRGDNPWANGSARGVVVRRGEELNTITLESGCGPVYVDDQADPGTAKLLRELAVPIVCALPSDGAKIAAALGEAASGELRLLSDVQVTVEVDGAPVTEDTPGFALIAPGSEWLVDLVIAALEYRSSQFRRYSERTLRETATHLREVQLVPARELRLSIDGHPPSDAAEVRGVFPVSTLSRTVIVVKDLHGNVGWETLEQVATPIAGLIGAPELGSVIFEAIVRLQRSQPLDGPLESPTMDQCADALNITRRQMDDVTALLQSTVHVLRDRIPVAVACLVSVNAGEGIAALLSGANNDDDVAAALARFDIDAPHDLLDIAKRVTDLAELRDELAVGYKDFNTVLAALGRATLADPAAHSHAFDYFIQSQRDAILTRLRQVFMPKFVDGADLSGYVKLRTRFPGLERDESWLEDYDIPTDPVMTAQVNKWLQQHGAPTLTDDREAGGRSVDAMRTANRRTVAAAGETAGALVRSWCVKTRHPCPQVWAGDGCGERLADWADEQGVLDFVELQDLRPLLAHLDRAEMWPPGMPRTLDPDSLSLTADDLSRGQSEQEQQRVLQHQARTTITLGSRRFSVEPDGFAEIAAAVRKYMPPALLQTPFRIDLGPPPTSSRSRDRVDGKSFYRNGTRYSEGQRQVIGLAAEVVALDWLKAQPQYADAVVTWHSGYRDKVEGGAQGDDTLGYDIDVVTKSRRFMFEVKGTAEDGTEFELTESEISAARRNTSRDAYRIIYVQHVLDPMQTSILLLPNPFSQRGAETYRVVGSGMHYRFAAPD